MNEKPATTKDITRNIIPAVEEIAEAVGVIAHAAREVAFSGIPLNAQRPQG